MIHMPKRSVTRFFIPLIDVLLLLFCIFLLMPISSENEVEKKLDEAEKDSYSLRILANELNDREQELDKYRKEKPQTADLIRMQEELDRLKKTQSLQQRAYFQIIDVDGKTGDISYFDPNLPTAKARLPLGSDVAARELIKRHQKEAGDNREVYYYFLYPRPETGFPTLAQERTYRKWFAQVANSLAEVKR